MTSAPGYEQATIRPDAANRVNRHCEKGAARVRRRPEPDRRPHPWSINL